MALCHNRHFVTFKSHKFFTLSPFFGKFSLTFAMLAFFFNAVLVSPFDEFLVNLVNGGSGATIHQKVQAAMSIISIGFGGVMSILGIWVTSNKSWNVMALIGFLAWGSMTIYAAYETEWHRLYLLDNSTYAKREIWFLVFGWAGSVCYFIAFSFAILADQTFKDLPDGVSLTTENVRNQN
jgi:hypothetical protein